MDRFFSVLSQSTRLMDGWKYGQTHGQTEFSSLDSSAIKISD